MRWMVVLLTAGLFCGCDKTTSSEVKSGDRPSVQGTRPLVGNSFNSYYDMSAKRRPVSPGAAKMSKAVVDDRAVALEASKANVEKAKAAWRADVKDEAKRRAYDDAVADLMGKMAAK